MPMAVKMAEEHGDDLVVLLVEVQGSSPEDIQRMALERKWFGHGALWTTERPMASPGRGIPASVLLDIEGRPIVSGNPLGLHSQIEDAIAAELKKVKRGPDGLHKDLKDAWKSAMRGKWSEAIREAEKIADEAGDDAALAEMAVGLADEWRDIAAKRVDRIERLVGQGYYERAENLAKDIEEELEALPEAETKLIALHERLESEELADERKAETALRKMEDKLFSKGARSFKAKSLEKLIEKFPGTKAAERARELLPLLPD